jgi:hypothetical protein
MGVRQCVECGAVLRSQNPGKLCAPCQEKHLKDRQETLHNECLGVDDMMEIFHLSAESVRRKARKGELPERITNLRKCLWERQAILEFIRSGHQVTSQHNKAILRAVELNWPVAPITGYGLEPDNLEQELKEFDSLIDQDRRTKDHRS